MGMDMRVSFEVMIGTRLTGLLTPGIRLVKEIITSVA